MYTRGQYLLKGSELNSILNIHNLDKPLCVFRYLSPCSLSINRFSHSIMCSKESALGLPKLALHPKMELLFLSFLLDHSQDEPEIIFFNITKPKFYFLI